MSRPFNINSPFNPIKRPNLINENGMSGIEFEGWVIKSNKGTILSSEAIDSYSSSLKMPLPEMIFGSNYLLLVNKDLDLEWKFDPMEALKLVDISKSSAELKVAYAKEWLNERADWDEVKHEGDPYDWTYTTHYQGTLNIGTCKSTTGVNDRINMDLLKAQEPILYYSDNILFEDELGDNGSSILNIKVRVMPTGYFILQRFSLRVDNVLFRTLDTRIYHRFGQNFLIKEFSKRECPYDVIAQKMNDTHDKSQLNDVNWVNSQMVLIQSEPDSLEVTKIQW